MNIVHIEERKKAGKADACTDLGFLVKKLQRGFLFAMEKLNKI